jgi:hypothetical protein
MLLGKVANASRSGVKKDVGGPCWYNLGAVHPKEFDVAIASI